MVPAQERGHAVVTPRIAIPPAGAAAANVLAWAAYASGGRWFPARHLRYLGRLLMALERGEILRLVISCPPRHGKSWLVSRYFPSWYLGRHPEQKVILLSMQERFSRKWGRMARDDFAAHAQTLWGVTTSRRASTAEWEITRAGVGTEGSMSSIGWSGTITGKGADLILVDDIIRNRKEAESEKVRDEQWETLESAVETRLEPPGRVVVVSTRWHHDDVIGRIEKKQRDGELGAEWVIVNLPALSGENDPLGRAPGEALWPERVTKDFLEKKSKNVGPYVWESLYQGRPSPLEGAILKKAWFRYYKKTVSTGRTLASFDQLGTCDVAQLEKFATVDLAASKKRRGDSTAIAIWGFHPVWKILVLLDLVCAQLGPAGIIPEMLKLQAEHKPVGAFYVEREGPALEEKLGHIHKSAARAGIPIVPLVPEKDKESRLIDATGAFASGQVYFLAGAPWLASYEEELLTFPESNHDDRVDVTSYGVALFNEAVANRASFEAGRAPPTSSPDAPPDDDGYDPWRPPTSFGGGFGGGPSSGYWTTPRR